MPPGRARGRALGRRSRDALEAFGQDLGVAFQMLDDLLDVSGPAARTGKHRGTDLLDGTVTLPLILAREQDPALAALDLREVSTREQAEEVCDRIAATDALEQPRAPAPASWWLGRKDVLRGPVDDRLESVLRSVADRVADVRVSRLRLPQIGNRRPFRAGGRGRVMLGGRVGPVA